MTDFPNVGVPQFPPVGSVGDFITSVFGGSPDTQVIPVVAQCVSVEVLNLFMVGEPTAQYRRRQNPVNSSQTTMHVVAARTFL